jgi:hypothetical protein
MYTRSISDLADLLVVKVEGSEDKLDLVLKLLGQSAADNRAFRLIRIYEGSSARAPNTPAFEAATP